MIMLSYLAACSPHEARKDPRRGYFVVQNDEEARLRFDMSTASEPWRDYRIEPFHHLEFGQPMSAKEMAERREFHNIPVSPIPETAYLAEPESIDDAARRLFAAEYPERNYDQLKPDTKIGWMRRAWDERND